MTFSMSRLSISVISSGSIEIHEFYDLVIILTMLPFK